MMIYSSRFLFLSAVFLLLVGSVYALEIPLRYDFSKNTSEENKVILQGAGFGQYPQANVSFGYIPTDNAFDGATDGQGAIITAKPGEGIMVFGRKITTKYSAMVRCSVRTDKSVASIILATIGDEPDVFVSTNTPNNKGYFVGQYLRLQTFCVPPSTGFQPVIQIINTSKTEIMTAYLDNLEITLIDPNKYYSGAYLDGNETDPPGNKISISSNAETSALPSIGEVTTISLPNLPDGAKALDMVFISSGNYVMGSNKCEKDHYITEEPQHQVTITKPFYLGQYEVTQGQWKAVMGTATSGFYGAGNNLPVYFVSWNECQTFIQKLNTLGLGTFRLPTEAEWEYACRAGSITRFYWGEDEGETQIKEYAWYSGNYDNKVREVGLKIPNNWGLFDMAGNVSEWCQDWFGDYPSNPATDPQGPSEGSRRVWRGADSNSDAEYCRSASRFSSKPDYSAAGGLRLVREYP